MRAVFFLLHGSQTDCVLCLGKPWGESQPKEIMGPMLCHPIWGNIGQNEPLSRWSASSQVTSPWNTCDPGFLFCVPPETSVASNHDFLCVPPTVWRPWRNARAALFKSKSGNGKPGRRQRLSQTAADQASRGDATIVPIQSSKKRPQSPNIVIREH